MSNNDSKSGGNASRFLYQPARINKGLRNEIGQNNCFLNVTIQAMWHLGPFRMHLRQLIASLARGKVLSSPIVDRSFLLALCNLFIQYEFTEEQVLPPDDLRSLLGQLDEKFEFGKIADANEALDAILTRIHGEFSYLCPDRCKCLAHQTFGGVVMEQVICSLCGASAEPTVPDGFLMYFQAIEMLREAAQENKVETTTGWNGQQKFRPIQRLLNFAKKKLRIRAQGEELSAIEEEKARLFGRILRKCMTSVGVRSCPSHDDPTMSHCIPCAGQASMSSFCLEPPLALALSFGWTDDHEEKENISSFMSIIPSTIYLDDLYSSGKTQEKNRVLPSLWRDTNTQPTQSIVHTGPSYALQGLVCYYGLHYVSFFQADAMTQSAEEMYFLFDDHRVRPIGSWGDVVKYCENSHYQPVLLLYELESNQGRDVELPARVIPDYAKLMSEVDLFNPSSAAAASSADAKQVNSKAESKSLVINDSKAQFNAAKQESGLNEHGEMIDIVEADDIYASHHESHHESHQRQTTQSSNGTTDDLLEGDWISLKTVPAVQHKESVSPPEKRVKSDSSSSSPSNIVPGIRQRNDLVSAVDVDHSRQPGRNKSNLSEYRAIADEIQHEFRTSMSQKRLPTIADEKTTYSREEAVKKVEFWSMRPYRYSLTVPIEKVNGKSFLGFEVHRDYSDESFAIISFVPHPTTKEAMFLERSNMVQLMDKLLKINGKEVRSYEVKQLNELIDQNDEPYVLLEFVSSYRTIKSFFCPECDLPNELEPSKDAMLQKAFQQGQEKDVNVSLQCKHCCSEVTVTREFPPPV